MSYDSNAPHYRAFLEWVHSPVRDGVWSTTLYPDGRATLNYRAGGHANIVCVESGRALVEVANRSGNHRHSIWLLEDDAYKLLAQGHAPSDLLEILKRPASVSALGLKGRYG